MTDQKTAPDVREPDAKTAVLRSFGRPGPGYWLLLAVLAAVVVLGLVAWVVQLRDGMSAAGYSNQAFWAVYLADVVTFIGVSYGGAVISAILRITGTKWRAPLTRLAEGTAVVTVLIGALLILPHLGNPIRVWELVTRPNLASPVFWDFVAVMTYTAASIVFFVLPLVPDMAMLRSGESARRIGRRRSLYAAMSRGWVDSPKQQRVLRGALGLISIMIIPLAVSVHSVLSWAFSLVDRPWWHESIWAPYFVVAALYSGVALVILVVASYRRAYHLQAFITDRHFVRLGFILAAFAATYLYLTFADLLPNGYVGNAQDSAVFHELLVGRYAIWFWLFVVGGGVVPLLLVALPWTRNARGMVIASVLVVPAMWLKRMLMVIDPANYNRIDNTFGAYHFTWVSISVTLAALAAIPLLLMLLFRVVPLLDIHEIEELAPAGSTAEQPAPMPCQTAEGQVATGSETAIVTRPASGRTRRGGRFGRILGAGAVVLVACLGVLGVGMARPAHADPAPATTTAATLVTVSGTNSGSTVRLTARLTTVDHAAVPKAVIQFTQSTTEFGKPRSVPIGTATTDTNGTAELVYQSTVAGRQQFGTTYAGGTGLATATSTTTVDVQTAQSAYHPAPPKPLASVGWATVAALLVVVALVWITLIAQVVRVFRVCRQ